MKLRLFSVFLLLVLWYACSARKNDFFTAKESHCIRRVIKADQKLGLVRNKQSLTLSLSQTIADYTDGMKTISAKNCPSTFAKAYDSHRQAWLEMLPITDKYPKMRGEMHVLFRQLEQSEDADDFKKKLSKIWATWAEVEKFVQK